MTEQKAATNPQENGFTIQRIYTKDISFETPNVPTIFTQEWKPELNLELNTSSVKLSEDVYEVSLRVTVTTKSVDQVAYICEVTQAGIFATKGLDELQLQHCLGAFCPSILFPYARETISTLVNKGTFQPVNLDPVNFDMLFANYLEQQKKSADNKNAENLQ